MRASYRFALRGSWLVLHIVTLAICVTMVLLGRWQLDVSNAKHFSLQNFGYAIQWWLFTAFALFLWFRFVRDAERRQHQLPEQLAQPPQQEAVTYRRYVMPNTQPTATDPVHSAYNDYLAELAAQDRDAHQ